ncbi:MAG: 30S ribosomal protein S16 [Patescibacteria group bacterium]
MLVLRLKRTGKRNDPTFRIVAAEKRSAVKGRCLEFIGHYLPTRNPVVFECNQDRISHWISKGAKPSDTLARLLTKEGMTGLEEFIETYTKKRKSKEEEVSEVSSAATAPAKSKDAPAEKAAEEKPVKDEVSAPQESEPEKESSPIEEERPQDAVTKEEISEQTPSGAEATEGEEEKQ